MSWSAERFLELHRKLRRKLCKEIFGHTMAVIVFSGLVIMSIVDVLKYKDADLRKLTAAILGICHFGLCASAILHLKYLGVTELNPLKCKTWIYLEVYNIAATTSFIVLATRHILPPPFHQWTGTALLLIIYWLPLIMFKTSQVCRMLEFVNILNYFQNISLHPQKHCRNKPDTVLQPQHQSTSNDTNTVTTCVVPPLSSCGNFPRTLSVTKPLSGSSPHVPYEWTLIESISKALP